jgi:hypothetical protein
MLPASSVFDLGDETEQAYGSFKAIRPSPNLALERFLGKHDATMSTEIAHLSPILHNTTTCIQNAALEEVAL